MQKKTTKKFDFLDFRSRIHQLSQEEGSTMLFSDLDPLYKWFFLSKKDDFLRYSYVYFLNRDPDADSQVYLPRLERIWGRLYVFGCIGSSEEARRKNIHSRALYFFCQGCRSLKYLAGGLRGGLRFPSRALHLPLKKKVNEFDQFYKYFEDNFRGPLHKVRSSLDAKYSKAIGSDAINQKALDLGCGRGEMICLLRDKGFITTGVDLNSIFVQELQKEKLTVKKQDALSFLKKQPDDAYHVITSLHLIEHLPFEYFVNLLKEIWRVLKPGGLLILETPNARNMHVSAGDFYRDPSHRNPIFPDTLALLLEFYNFQGQCYFFDAEEHPYPSSDVAFETIESYYAVSRDMAWIGQKPKSIQCPSAGV